MAINSLINEPHYNIEFIFDDIYRLFGAIDKATIVNQLDYSEFIDVYKKIVLNSKYDYPLNKIDGYTRRIELGNGYYNVYWDISRLKKIIALHKIEPVPFDVVYLYERVDKNEIKEEYVRVEDTPVCNAQVQFLSSQDIPIDGNHRIVGAYRANIKTIRAFDIPYQLHSQAITSSYIKLLMSVQYNLWLLSRYMLGEINRIMFSQNLIDIFNHSA